MTTEVKALIERFDHLRSSGVCSPTTRGLLDDSQALLTALTTPPAYASRVLSIAAEIVSERGRQDAKWGAPHDVADGTGPDELFMTVPFIELRDEMQSRVDLAVARGASRMSWVLLEEVFEALAEDDEQKLRAELIQVGAVAAKWVQIIDARDIS